MDQALDQYDIEVELTLLPTEESGLRGPIFSGYRGGHIYLDKIEWIAGFDLKDRTELHPGETAPVLVRFFYHPEALVGRLWVGRDFLLVDGGVVGRGTITSMLNFDAHVEQFLRHNVPHDKRSVAGAESAE